MAGELTTAFVGDICIRRDDPPSIFAHAAPVLRKADITFGNAEGPLCDRGQPIGGKGEINSRHLGSHPRAVEGLLAAGFDGVGVANNHSLDYSEEGLLQTLEVLNGAKIPNCGGGRNITEAHKPVILERAGTKIAFLSYSSVFMSAFPATETKPGIAVVRASTTYQPNPRLGYQPGAPMTPVTTPDPNDRKILLEDIRRAKAQADLVILYWHWGVSQRWGRVADYQKELGKAALDAGADAIIGHHPHMLLGIEMYKGKPICYSLGNFAFDLKEPHFRYESVIVRCYVQDKKIQRVSFLPVYINEQSQPVILDPKKEGQKVVWFMEYLSEDFGTVFKPEGEEIVVRPPKGG